MSKTQITANLNKMHELAKKAHADAQAVIRAYDEQRSKDHLYGLAILALLLIVGALQ